MLCVLFLLSVSLFAASNSANNNLFEAKAGLTAVWNFEGVTECILGYSALLYNNYGCYCGIGGSGVPIDGIDTCCKIHDMCYDQTVKEGKCDEGTEYYTGYDWNCTNGAAICGEDQGECEAALCACDTAVVNCWKKFPMPQGQKICDKRKLRIRGNLIQ